MTGPNRLSNARAEIAPAADALRVAQAARDLGIYRDAMSRAYYAAFHAARALVLLEGEEPRTHGGLSRLFNDHVVRTGKLEARYNLLLTRLQAYRQASDYAFDFALAEDDVRSEIDAAAELVDRARGIVEAATTSAS